MHSKIKQLLKDIYNGDHKALARGITILENKYDGYEDLLLQLKNTQKARLVGITGPPGAGKSTLVNALLQHWVKEKKKIAVIAVDPSSPFNYGSLLGDRIRMSAFYNNPNVFIRSLASRGALGGLHPMIIEIADLVKNAEFDIILIETVGVGQSEVEIAGLADCTVVTMVPEAGDEIQTMKAGIMEIADIFVVNKADRMDAEQFYRALKIMVHEKAKGNETPVVKTVALEHKGIDELSLAIEKHLAETNDVSTEQIQLLTDKCWRLIESNKMAGLNKNTIKQALEKALKEPDFNLYAFAKKY